VEAKKTYSNRLPTFVDPANFLSHYLHLLNQQMCLLIFSFIAFLPTLRIAPTVLMSSARLCLRRPSRWSSPVGYLPSVVDERAFHFSVAPRSPAAPRSTTPHHLSRARWCSSPPVALLPCEPRSPRSPSS